MFGLKNSIIQINWEMLNKQQHRTIEKQNQSKRLVIHGKALLKSNIKITVFFPTFNHHQSYKYMYQNTGYIFIHA